MYFIDYCIDSCFGNIKTDIGFLNFMCTGTESRLVDCSSFMNAGCGEAAGVYCGE